MNINCETSITQASLDNVKMTNKVKKFTGLLYTYDSFTSPTMTITPKLGAPVTVNLSTAAPGVYMFNYVSPTEADTFNIVFNSSSVTTATGQLRLQLQ